MFYLQDVAWVGAPELQHLPCFTQRLISRSAFSVMLRESSTSVSSQRMLLLIWLLLVSLQTFWVLFQWSSASRRKVKMCDLASPAQEL